MLHEFIGRREELALLEEVYGAKRSGLIPIYGRRRVGKSELILRFIGDKPALYHVGKKGPAALQLREFLQEAALVAGEPLLANLQARDWKTALCALVDRWTRPEKLVLALDEFQWTAAASPELPSVLQECWDRWWSRSGKVLLLLCGSYVGFMERTVLGRGSPLFGRRTAQIHLKPFGYLEAAEFHPGYSLADRARTFFICGGVPLYLRYFSPDRSLEMNIAENFLSELSPLYREPDFLLREELRDVESYYAVLLAVATGSATNREISLQSGIGERSLHYYLQQLLNLGYLSRRYPLVGGPVILRQVRYVLGDPLLRFYFRFVYPNNSVILHVGPARVLTERIRPGLASYFGTCFEGLCREALPLLYAREEVAAAFEVGEYWDRATQIDVVGLRDDAWTDLGECRWGAVRTAREVVSDLEEKVLRYPNRRNATIQRRAFTQRPLRNAVRTAPNVRWHSLEDLY
ncbi:MAG: ATP-binding protein [Candidatus Riflebacteria bacterium]|nr:ATP-binding protein [Candidatus Riflebacteria bacterium]